MAFFLMMWLLGSISKGDLKGISEYFSTPLKIAMSGGTTIGDATSIVKGGGTDLSRKEGQVNKDDGMRSKPKDLKAANAELVRLENERLGRLKMKIESLIDANKILQMFKKQLLLDITSEGLRIQIVDEKNRPMFALASAELQPYTKEILYHIGVALNDVPNKISLSGHTDAKPFAGGGKGYSNWELSSDRANASRRALIVGGMEETKVVRVIGLASSVLMDKEHPEDPINRRISIVVMNKKAEEEALKDDDGALDVVTASDIEKGLKADANQGGKQKRP
ncbi:MAG: flagellar motor protein MotB, partial [Burkholderiaceae bacterium]|jgi:chemotaxis protein MotB|nr:flagellar motor protein MotB [Burkholderiaceae bacterium]